MADPTLSRLSPARRNSDPGTYRPFASSEYPSSASEPREIAQNQARAVDSVSPPLLKTPHEPEKGLPDHADHAGRRGQAGPAAPHLSVASDVRLAGRGSPADAGLRTTVPQPAVVPMAQQGADGVWERVSNAAMALNLNNAELVQWRWKQKFESYELARGLGHVEAMFAPDGIDEASNDHVRTRMFRQLTADFLKLPGHDMARLLDMLPGSGILRRFDTDALEKFIGSINVIPDQAIAGAINMWAKLLKSHALDAQQSGPPMKLAVLVMKLHEQLPRIALERRRPTTYRVIEALHAVLMRIQAHSLVRLQRAYLPYMTMCVAMLEKSLSDLDDMDGRNDTRARESIGSCRVMLARCAGERLPEFDKSPPTADEETQLKEAEERVSRLHTVCNTHVLDERWERLQKNVKDLRPVLRARMLEGIMAEHDRQGFNRIGLNKPTAACDFVVDQAVNLPPEHLARFLPRFLSLFQGFMGSASHLKEHEAMAALIEVMHGCVLKMPAESCGDMLIQLIDALNNLLTIAHIEGQRLSAAAIERIEACFNLLAGSLDRIGGAGESAAKEKMVACKKMIGRFK